MAAPLLFNLRLASEGAPIQGQFDGEYLIWSAAARKWRIANPVPPIPPAPVVGFDFVISSRADLVAVTAPVAGVFTLPDGSYSLRGDVLLEPGERLSVPGSVLLVSSAYYFIVGTSAAPHALITVGGNLQAFGVNIYNSGSPQPAVRQTTGAANVVSVGVFSDGASADAWEMEGSGVILQASNAALFGTRSGLHMIGGRAYAVGCNFSAGSAANGGGVRMTGVPLLKSLFASACEFLMIGSSNPAVLMDSLNARVSVESGLMGFDQAGVPAVIVLQGRSLNLGAGLVATQQGGSAPNFLSVRGNIDSIDVSHVRLEGFHLTCDRVAGTVVNAKFMAVKQGTGGGAFINWSSGAIPANGLQLLGNSSETAAFYSGFTEATPMVNSKGNTRSGALVAETPIVP